MGEKGPRAGRCSGGRRFRERKNQGGCGPLTAAARIAGFSYRVADWRLSIYWKRFWKTFTAPEKYALACPQNTDRKLSDWSPDVVDWLAIPFGLAAT